MFKARYIALLCWKCH